jgi:hypothetical protein
MTMTQRTKSLLAAVAGAYLVLLVLLGLLLVGLGGRHRSGSPPRWLSRNAGKHKHHRRHAVNPPSSPAESPAP